MEDETENKKSPENITSQHNEEDKFNLDKKEIDKKNEYHTEVDQHNVLKSESSEKVTVGINTSDTYNTNDSSKPYNSSNSKDSSTPNDSPNPNNSSTQSDTNNKAFIDNNTDNNPIQTKSNIENRTSSNEVSPAHTSPMVTEVPQDVELKVYPKRWLILLTVVFINISNAALWINYSPIIFHVAEFYDVKTEVINWFSLVFLLISIPFVFVATFAVDRVGLRPTIHVGAFLNTVGAILRAIGTSPLITSKSAQFGVSLFGQVLAAMAQSFCLYLPTKVSQLWFPNNQRAISTTFMSMSNPLGIVLATAISPFLVDDQSEVPQSNYIWLAPVLLAQLFTVLCVTSSKPPSPPSHSEEIGEQSRAPYLSQLKTVFTSVPYLLLLLTLGGGIGLFSALATVTVQVLCPLGYSKEFSGMSTALLVLSGFVGSAISGILVDRTKAFTPITKIFFGCAALSAILMFEFFLVPHQKAAVLIFSCMFGFFGVGGYPIGLELSVETTYPIEETITTAFIFMSGQLHGVLFIAGISLLSIEQHKYLHLQVCNDINDIQPKDYTNSLLVCMGYLSIVVCILILFFKTKYKRLLQETPQQGQNSPHELEESIQDRSSRKSSTPSGGPINTVTSDLSVDLPSVEVETDSDEKQLIFGANTQVVN